MQKRIIFTILVSVIVILFSLGIISNISVNESIKHSLDQRKELASIIANYFDNLLRINLSRLYDVSLSGLVDLTDNNLVPETKALATLYQYSLFSDGVFLLDIKGEVILSYPSSQIQTNNLITLPEIQKVINERKPVVSDIKTIKETMRKVLYMFVPLKDIRGNLVGVVGGEINPTAHILNDVIRSIPAGAETEIELVDINGFVIASNNPKSIFTCSDRNQVLNKLIQEKEKTVITCHRCHVDKNDKEEKKNQKSTDMLAFAPLLEAPWGVSVRDPKKNVFAPSFNLRKKFFILGIIAIASSLILAMGMSKSIVTPIRSLIRATNKIAAGDLKVPVKIYSRDEIGMLSQSFDKMRRKLSESIDKIQNYNTELEKRVYTRTKELEKNKERLANLLKKIISAQEDERERIARELHDETSQALAALGVSLEISSIALKEKKLSQKDIHGLTEKVSSIIDGINRLIRDLRPPVLDDLGFESAIRWLLQRHLSDKGIHYQLNSSDFFNKLTLGKDGTVDDRAELLLFRIIQEAVINISKHANARNVSVSLLNKDKNVEVTVNDDGVGFNVVDVFRREESGGHIGYGIVGLRERVSLLDGKLYIDSKKGKGTSLNVTIPLSSLEIKHG